MSEQPFPVVIAADTEAVRERCTTLVRTSYGEPHLVGNSGVVWKMTPEQIANALILLETAGDVAHLVQCVNDLHYSPYHLGGEVNAICIVPEAVFTQNQRLGFWLIEGHAAVFCVWTTEYLFSEAEALSGLLARFSNYVPVEEVPALPEYQELVAELFEGKNPGEATCKLVERLNVWQDDHQMNREMRIALARQAVRLMPDNDRAHRLLGASLAVHSQKEEALQELEIAYRLDPKSAENNFDLGRFFHWDNRESAVTLLQRAIELGEGTQIATWARNVLASIRARGEDNQ